MNIFENLKRSLKLHHVYYCMQRSYLADSIASFVFCEYCRPQSRLEKANYYVSGCCDKNTRINFLKLTQKHAIFHHFILLLTILGWATLFAFALCWNVIDECAENVVLASIITLGITLMLIPWFKTFRKLINEYKEIPKKYSLCFSDLDYQIQKELSWIWEFFLDFYFIHINTMISKNFFGYKFHVSPSNKILYSSFSFFENASIALNTLVVK